MNDKFINWYEDDELSIEFSEIPRVGIRYVLPSSSDVERASIKRFPFINKRKFDVRLYNKEKEEIYDFSIYKNYCFDGATIPRLFWRIIGSKTDNAFLIGALIHDVLTENHNYINNDRNFSSKVFRALLIAGGVGELKAQVMYLAVDNFQRFCGWNKN